jgi:hypothetical protein
MEYTYKSASVYADIKENVWIIPSGANERWGGTSDIDIVHYLGSPYSNYELGTTLMTALAECYSKKPDLDSKSTVIERFLHIKGYAKAVIDKKFFSVEWKAKEGYKVIPTRQEHKPKKGFLYMNDRIIRIKQEPSPEELAEAVREAIRISTI